jgi:hypothetical protein
MDSRGEVVECPPLIGRGAIIELAQLKDMAYTVDRDQHLLFALAFDVLYLLKSSPSWHYTVYVDKSMPSYTLGVEEHPAR